MRILLFYSGIVYTIKRKYMNAIRHYKRFQNGWIVILDCLLDCITQQRILRWLKYPTAERIDGQISRSSSICMKFIWNF